MFWGPPYWRFIHYFSMYDLRDLVLQVKNFIPCPDCKSEWYDPAPEENLLDWSRELHNKVNKKLGRYDKWDARDLNISHKPHCDVCEEKEFIHRFPWVFIHFVAVQPNSMNFLKAFNAQYPCDKHRGTFLDKPLPDESTLDWVIRNNKKVDPNFVKPAYMLPPPTPMLDPVSGLPILNPTTGQPLFSTPGAPLIDQATGQIIVDATTGQPIYTPTAPCPTCPYAQAQIPTIAAAPQPQTQAPSPLLATITTTQTVDVPNQTS